MPRIIPIHWEKLEKVFLKSRFEFSRQEVSHRSYVKAGIIRPVVIPARNEVPLAIIRNILKTANISRDEYFSLLED